MKAPASEAAVLPMLRGMSGHFSAEVEERRAGDALIYDIAPIGLSADSRGVILEMHGGGPIMCGAKCAG